MEDKFLDILDKVLESADDFSALKYYAFSCSVLWKCSIIEYKGFPVYYSKLIYDDSIYLMPSPYFQDYEATN
jgi:hypothetical protein